MKRNKERRVQSIKTWEQEKRKRNSCNIKSRWGKTNLQSLKYPICILYQEVKPTKNKMASSQYMKPPCQWVLEYADCISFRDCSKCTNNIWYHSHVPQFCLFCFSFSLLSFYFCEFLTSAFTNGLSLESLQVFRTLLSILTDHNNAALCMVSIHPLIYNSSSLLLKFWGPFQVHQLQLVLLSPLCSTAFFVL